MHLHTAIHIAASPAEVWAVLTDFDSYPQWNPFVRWLKGRPVVGQQIEVALPGMNFKPEVLVFEAGKEFRWKGKLWIKGLFDGEHFFVLQPHGNGTLFQHGEHFGGLLLPLFKGMIESKTKAGFEEMNRALKARVEG